MKPKKQIQMPLERVDSKYNLTNVSDWLPPILGVGDRLEDPTEDPPEEEPITRGASFLDTNNHNGMEIQDKDLEVFTDDEEVPKAHPDDFVKGGDQKMNVKNIIGKDEDIDDNKVKDADIKDIKGKDEKDEHMEDIKVKEDDIKEDDIKEDDIKEDDIKEDDIKEIKGKDEHMEDIKVKEDEKDEKQEVYKKNKVRKAAKRSQPCTGGVKKSNTKNVAFAKNVALSDSDSEDDAPERKRRRGRSWSNEL